MGTRYSFRVPRCRYPKSVCDVRKKSTTYELLSRTDRCFQQLSGHHIHADQLIPSLLIIRAHGSFRAAAEHAMAGQISEAFGDARVLLESAAYSLHINLQPELSEIWLRRHDSPEHANKVRAQFAFGKLKEAIRSKDGRLSQIFDQLYQSSIDFGAHPNERAITGNLKISDRADNRHLDLIQLQGDGLALDHGLRSVAQAGVCALHIVRHVFPERFELLGINEEIMELRKTL